jgi:uncharacterized protein
MRVPVMMLWLGLLSAEASAQAPTSASRSTKEVAIRHLLQVTGGGRLAVQAIDTMMSTFKQAFPRVPEEFWTEFRSEVREDDIIDWSVPIYDKYFSEEEVLGLVAFYATPLGKRLLEAQPLVLQESMQAGKEWGRALGQKVIERLKQKGYGGPATGR